MRESVCVCACMCVYVVHGLLGTCVACMCVYVVQGLLVCCSSGVSFRPQLAGRHIVLMVLTPKLWGHLSMFAVPILILANWRFQARPCNFQRRISSLVLWN